MIRKRTIEKQSKRIKVQSINTNVTFVCHLNVKCCKNHVYGIFKLIESNFCSRSCSAFDLEAAKNRREAAKADFCINLHTKGFNEIMTTLLPL